MTSSISASGPVFSRIIGTGSELPGPRISNAQLTARLAADGVETSDEWIVERTGIRNRHFAAPGVGASDLGVAAAKKALAAAGLKPSGIDLVICATSTPDMVFPSTATLIQQKLGAEDPGIFGCAAMDVQAVCTGFIYALSTADALIRAGQARTALVIGTEVFSRILDFKDRTTCVLFGDGAGAVVLQASATPGVLASELHADGRHVDILCTPGTVSGGEVLGSPLLRMDGQAVFKLAVGVLADVAKAVIAKAGHTESDVDWLIPHQANIRIMEATGKKLRLPREKLVATVDLHGNTSAASVPLALDVAVRDGRVKPGHQVLLEGVGGGFTWGAALVRM